MEDGILNALVIVAGCQPYEAALAVWDSALNRGLVTKMELARLPLRPAARQVLDAATPFSDSGLETIFAIRLKWLRLPIRAQIWILEHHVDFLIGSGWWPRSTAVTMSDSSAPKTSRMMRSSRCSGTT